MNIPHPVLAIYPASRGFGWILFDSARSPFDWGSVYIQDAKNVKALIRIKALFRRFHPRLLVLEAFEDEASRRRARVKQLCRAVVRSAEKSHIAVRLVSRKDVAAALGAELRDQVAIRVADEIEPLRPRLPKSRPIWVGEGLGIAIFNAAACVLTLYANSGTR